VIPGLRYRDAPAAIDWLCRAFGFERQLVVPGEGGTIAHAQLRFGRGMVMVGSSGAHGGGFDALVKSPGEAGGVGAQSVYAVVDDADAHLARARAAGAEIVLEIRDRDYGGRDYTCRDPEGHVWTFGTYDPWEDA
jgi:uncharacterized glyoxalase superfamily protein PhnB